MSCWPFIDIEQPPFPWNFTLPSIVPAKSKRLLVVPIAALAANPNNFPEVSKIYLAPTTSLPNEP